MDEREPARPDDDLEPEERLGDGGAPEPAVTVEISGLSLYTQHGVTEAERELGQRLVIDVTFELEDCDAMVTDRVEDTVDYADACEQVALAAQERSYKTLERLCAAIADRLMDRYGTGVGAGEGREAGATDPAAGRRGLGRGVARGLSAGAGCSATSASGPTRATGCAP